MKMTVKVFKIMIVLLCSKLATLSFRSLPRSYSHKINALVCLNIIEINKIRHISGYTFQLTPAKEDYPADWDGAPEFRVDIEEANSKFSSLLFICKERYTPSASVYKISNNNRFLGLNSCQ